MAAAHHVCGGLMLSETHTDAVMYTYRVKHVMHMTRTKFRMRGLWSWRATARRCF